MSTPSESMKGLIDDLITILETAITSSPKTIEAKSIQKAISDDPSEVPTDQWPFIAIDDGGERIEETQSETTQQRAYMVRIQVNCYDNDFAACMDSVLDRYNELKVVMEKNANRLMDGYTWGVAVTPFTWDNEEGGFFRGRELIVEYLKIEFRESQH